MRYLTIQASFVLKQLVLRFIFLLFFVVLNIASAYATGNALGSKVWLYLSFYCTIFLPYAMLRHVVLKRVYWLLLCITVLLWSLVEAGHYVQERAPFNELALKILYESNGPEMLEYTTTTVPIPIIVLSIVAIVVLLIAIARIKHSVVNFSLAQKIKLYLPLTISALYYLFFASGAGAKAGFFIDEYNGHQVLKKYYANCKMSRAHANALCQPLQFSTQQKGNAYVLILSESTSRHHMSKYGYWRATTPHLDTNKSAIPFVDVISSHTSTVECLNRCLTLPQNGTHDFSCPSIIDIANHCGFSTYWLSNQASSGLLTNSITTATSRASKQFFVIDAYPKLAVAQRNDMYLLPQLQKALQDTASNKLIVLHLMGNHFKYNKRYTSQYDVFKTNEQLKQAFPYANNDEKLNTINEYDNATLFQDAFVDSVFTILSAVQNAQAIYLSDHGEEVYDYRNFVGHTPQGANPWLHDIPFVAWRLPDSLLHNTQQPYQLTSMCTSLCHWMNIYSPVLNYEQSIFSNTYKPTQRTLCNGSAYTAVKKK